MEGRRAASDPAGTARVIHGAIIGGVIVIFATLAFLAGTMTTPEGAARHALRIAGYVTIALAFVLGKIVRDRIAATDHSLPSADWWSAHMGKAVTLWAVLEGGGVIPILIGFLAEDRLLAGLGAAVSLVLLFSTRPSVLAAPRP